MTVSSSPPAAILKSPAPPNRARVAVAAPSIRTSPAIRIQRAAISNREAGEVLIAAAAAAVGATRTPNATSPRSRGRRPRRRSAS